MNISHLKKSFGTVEVLKDVSLNVERGDAVAILGPSGSGKTTLLRCINFLEQADEGTLVFEDIPHALGRISKKEMAGIRKKNRLCVSKLSSLSQQDRPAKRDRRVNCGPENAQGSGGGNWEAGAFQGGVIR